jgi:hypothetical protein
MRAVREQERLFSEMSRRAADAGLADERNDVCVRCAALPSEASMAVPHARSRLRCFFSCRVPPGAFHGSVRPQHPCDGRLAAVGQAEAEPSCKSQRR